METFRAVSEPRRPRLVEILARRDQLSASQICDEFDVTPQAISQHLRVLREANMLQMEKRTQRRLSTFNPRSMCPIQEWSADIAGLWNSRFDRLDKALEEEAA